MADRRQIIDRIEKLYALASGGTSPGEAVAATTMAEKLMKKYGIKDSEVNKHRYTKGEQASSYKEAAKHWQQRSSSSSSKNKYSQWQQAQEDFRHQYYQKTFELVKSKATVPDDKEIEENSRARSAKMRTGIKV